MCARYTLTPEQAKLVLAGLVHIFAFAPRYNIGPAQRVPVIIPPNHFDWWLKDDDGRSESHKMALGHPLEEPLKIYPVSDLVNSPKTDDARCIEPVRIERDFFERQWWGDGAKS